MALEIKRKEGESNSAFLFRFTKKMQQSGILKESKRRRTLKRGINKNKRRTAAIYRDTKKKEVLKAKKMGLI
ncbi:MAG: hypothetical protein AAB757_01880 [Patescibacteria group bacterium]